MTASPPDRSIGSREAMLGRTCRRRGACYSPAVPGPFSWSASRHDSFASCRRRYYYSYYAAVDDPEVRRLKKLSALPLWAGSVVHDTIEAFLRSNDTLPPVEEQEALIRSVVHSGMLSSWRESEAFEPGAPGPAPEPRAAAGEAEDAPPPREPFRLFEHEYGVPVRDAEWQAIRDNVVRCLRNFHRLPLLAEVKATPTERWIFIEDIGAFDFEGTRVFSAPDFGYWTTADRLQLVDWKTGGNGGDASLQLGGYALYALEVLGVDPARVDLLEVNLREGKVTSHPWDEVSLERVREHIRFSTRAMRAYLRDAARNLAEEPDFERAEDLRICRWCNFRAVCRPELPPFEPAAPEAERAGSAG